MSNRILEAVKGYEAAVKAIRSCVSCFNDCNGEGRMTAEKSGLAAYDNEGSGEFYEAHCININEAASSADEIYEIQTSW